MKTKLINGTNRVITLKEGNSGIQRFLSTLAKKGNDKSFHELDVDVNATYKEYHFFEIPSSSAVLVVCSDDLAAYKDITIVEVSDGAFTWNGTSRNADKARTKPDSPASSGGFVGWLKSKFSRSPPANDGSLP